MWYGDKLPMIRQNGSSPVIQDKPVPGIEVRCMERVKRIFRIEVISLVFSVGWGVLAAADWPQWRGPDGNGVSNETGLAFRWNESEGLKWKTELPQWGTSQL